MLKLSEEESLSGRAHSNQSRRTQKPLKNSVITNINKSQPLHGNNKIADMGKPNFSKPSLMKKNKNKMNNLG